jgi:DNA-binding CsgD family transcriptional regulator
VAATEFLMAVADAATICAELGDEHSASALYTTLLPHTGRHVAVHAFSTYHGPVDLALGRLARLLGDTVAARSHLEAALRSCEAIHALPSKALALEALAEVTSPRSRSRSELVDAAIELAERLGMEATAGRVRALVEGRAAVSVALTPRESEVAELVALGLSNAVIAKRLSLSERTVENHVSRILIKLDLPSRTALAVWVERRSPTGP